ncbi:hypothetical protein DL96DRAFT_1716291 [Flagelloscypha sp. PMI_526]|nr:hypothetical protein DL96DRAFT_1716291 [Flagelloscypha sp. PMI_526]
MKTGTIRSSIHHRPVRQRKPESLWRWMANLLFVSGTPSILENSRSMRRLEWRVSALMRDNELDQQYAGIRWSLDIFVEHLSPPPFEGLVSVYNQFQVSRHFKISRHFIHSMFTNLVVALLLALASLSSPKLPVRRQEFSTAGPASDGTLPKHWVYQGCWVDGANGRVLKRLDYDGAGLGYGKFLNAGALAETDDESNMLYNGATGEACGSGSRIPIYSESACLSSFFPTVKLVTESGWVYKDVTSQDTDARVTPDFYR